MSLLFQDITSKTNPRIVRVAKYADKKHRDADGVFVCEGIKLLEEAIFARASIREIYVSDSAALQWSEKLEALLARCSCRELFRVSDDLYKKISTENAPQGILAVVCRLHNINRCAQVMPDPLETVMLFEAVRDPGNLGTLIRTATAFGFDRLILSADCADVFNPKVVRAAMGAVFKIKIDYCDNLVDTVRLIGRSGRRVLAALPRERAIIAGRDLLQTTDCIVVGNEGHGLSAPIVDACTDAIYIPMEENTESLNAAIASSILMWEIAKTK